MFSDFVQYLLQDNRFCPSLLDNNVIIIKLSSSIQGHSIKSIDDVEKKEIRSVDRIDEMGL